MASQPGAYRRHNAGTRRYWTRIAYLATYLATVGRGPRSHWRHVVACCNVGYSVGDGGGGGSWLLKYVVFMETKYVSFFHHFLNRFPEQFIENTEEFITGDAPDIRCVLSPL